MKKEEGTSGYVVASRPAVPESFRRALDELSKHGPTRYELGWEGWAPPGMHHFILHVTRSGLKRSTGGVLYSREQIVASHPLVDSYGIPLPLDMRTIDYIAERDLFVQMRGGQSRLQAFKEVMRNSGMACDRARRIRDEEDEEMAMSLAEDVVRTTHDGISPEAAAEESKAFSYPE